jgi:hypothetical protein
MAAMLLPGVCTADLRDAVRTVYKIGASGGNGAPAVGSAVVIAPGKLVTSCHTVRDALRIYVLHPEGQLQARLGTANVRQDLCALSVPELRGPVALPVPSSAVQVGQPVVAVGFAEGFARSVEEGRITALYPMDGGQVLRTSAVFPRGASGGGLFTVTGQLVGILTFRAAASEQLNYAVPTEWVERLLEQDALAATEPDLQASFWEDRARHQPHFLQAAWFEATQAWDRLEAVALDWTLADSDDAGAWLALGQAQLGLGKVKEAALALRSAVARDEHSVTAWYWLAVAYHSIGYPGEFVYASNRVQSLDRERGDELRRWTSTNSP